MNTPSVDLLTALPQELTALTERYSLSPLLNRPFFKEELEWLFTTRRSRTVFYALGDQCEVEHYSMDIAFAVNTVKCKKLVKTAIRISIEQDDGYVGYTFCYDESELLSRVLDCLEDRTLIEKGRPSTHWLTMEEDLWADVVILDVRGVFLLLEGRLRVAGVNTATLIARKRAHQFLREVADFYQGNVIALDLYLSSSVINLELNEEPVKYEWYDDLLLMTSELLQRVRERCDKYLLLLTNAIEKM